MRQFVFVAALLLLALAAGNLMTAQEKAEKAVAVTKIIFNNGSKYDGKVPADLKPLAKEIKSSRPDATFRVEKEILYVGFSLQAEGAGQILSLAWESDCPVNSRYQSEQPKEIAMNKQLLRQTAVAWTRARHKHLGLANAEVHSYTDLGGGRLDVTLAKPADTE